MRTHPLQRDGHGAGFSLVELLLACGLSAAVGLLALQAVVACVQATAQLDQQLRQRGFERRARLLMADDRALARAEGSVATGPAPACSLSGRQPVLHLLLPDGRPPITWSLGAAPSSIWRGQVLMRCGPAYGLDGSANLTGAWQNRVVVDGQ